MKSPALKAAAIIAASRLKSITPDAVSGIDKLKRGQVWCRTCGSTQRVDSAKCLAHGWPKCCGYTMTIDSPMEWNTHD